jgi:hypothetical protein
MTDCSPRDDEGARLIARAYQNWGRWVADCPRPGCTYAFGLERGQARYLCRNKAGQGCGMEAPIEWPPDAEQIEKALEQRPVEQTRNWHPRDHELAIRAGEPHGQTVADLVAETRLMQEEAAKWRGPHR